MTHVMMPSQHLCTWGRGEKEKGKGGAGGRGARKEKRDRKKKYLLSKYNVRDRILHVLILYLPHPHCVTSGRAAGQRQHLVAGSKLVHSVGQRCTCVVTPTFIHADFTISQTSFKLVISN